MRVSDHWLLSVKWILREIISYSCQNHKKPTKARWVKMQSCLHLQKLLNRTSITRYSNTKRTVITCDYTKSYVSISNMWILVNQNFREQNSDVTPLLRRQKRYVRGIAKSLVISVCPPVYRLSLDDFSWNCVFKYFFFRKYPYKIQDSLTF